MASREIKGHEYHNYLTHNIPIKLPDGRFAKEVGGWRLSSLFKPRPKMLMLEDKDYKRYVVAQFIDEENI